MSMKELLKDIQKTLEQMVMEQEKKALSPEECAEKLGISICLCRKKIQDGTIPSKKVGRRIIVPTVQLDKWLEGGGNNA